MQSRNLMGSLRLKNISEVIIERIVSSIMSGELHRGEKLPSEEAFAERLGVGRSSVREAIKILEAMGIVEIRRADGTYIVDEFKSQMMDPLLLGMLMADKSSSDILEFRILVQRMVFGELIASVTEHQLDSCISLLDRIERKSSMSLQEHNTQLHAAELCLGEQVGNPLVRELHAKTTQISAYMQLQALSNLPADEQFAFTTFLRNVIAAIEASEADEIEELLAQERLLLSNGIK